MIDINFINNQDKIKIPDNMEDKIKLLILSILQYEDVDSFCEISMLFVDNEKIRDLNNEYRGKDVETDVLSFPQYENLEEIKKQGEFVLLGDVVISLEKAYEQANEFGHSVTREICYLTAHSIFHLLGYDHIEEDDKKIMRKKEEEVLSSLEIFR